MNFTNNSNKVLEVMNDSSKMAKGLFNAITEKTQLSKIGVKINMNDYEKYSI